MRQIEYGQITTKLSHKRLSVADGKQIDSPVSAVTHIERIKYYTNCFGDRELASSYSRKCPSPFFGMLFITIALNLLR